MNIVCKISLLLGMLTYAELSISRFIVIITSFSDRVKKHKANMYIISCEGKKNRGYLILTRSWWGNLHYELECSVLLSLSGESMRSYDHYFIIISLLTNRDYLWGSFQFSIIHSPDEYWDPINWSMVFACL